MNAFQEYNERVMRLIDQALNQASFTKDSKLLTYIRMGVLTSMTDWHEDYKEECSKSK